MQLIRSGPLKADFGVWAAGVLATNIKDRGQTSQASSQATSKASGKAGPSKKDKEVLPEADAPAKLPSTIHLDGHGAGTDKSPSLDDTPPSLNGKFSKFVATVQLLFAVPILDAAGTVIQLDPPTLTEDFLAAIDESSSIKELTREMMRIMYSKVQETEGKSIDFLLRSADPPAINHALMGYSIGSSFHSIGFSKNKEKLKSSFTMFAWTPPPQDNKVYQDHLRETTNNIADKLLSHPEFK